MRNLQSIKEVNDKEFALAHGWRLVPLFYALHDRFGDLEPVPTEAEAWAKAADLTERRLKVDAVLAKL